MTTDRVDGVIDCRTMMGAVVGGGTILLAEPVRARTQTVGQPRAMPVGTMELFRAARAPTTPTGVVVSRRGRVFVFMPRFDDKTAYTVGEVARDGGVTPYPSAALNRPDSARASEVLIHIPNGVVDAQDRL